MGAFYDEIPNEDIETWILEQKIFWVGTAPLSGQGHVNLSPKGRPTFELAGKNACWYIDMTGSGNESLSHLYEEGNGRITIMFTAFEGPPRIVRFFGTGKVFERGSPEFAKFLPDGDERILPGTRAVIWIDIHKVSTSCGFSVPFFDYAGERLTLDQFYEKLEVTDVGPSGFPQKLQDYWDLKNSRSIDRLPGLKFSDPTKSLVTPFDLSTQSTEQNYETAAQKGKSATVCSGQRANSVTISRQAYLTSLALMFLLGLMAVRTSKLVAEVVGDLAPRA